MTVDAARTADDVNGTIEMENLIGAGGSNQASHQEVSAGDDAINTPSPAEAHHPLGRKMSQDSGVSSQK